MVTNPIRSILPCQIDVVWRRHLPNGDPASPLLITGYQIVSGVIVSDLVIRETRAWIRNKALKSSRIDVVNLLGSERRVGHVENIVS